MVRRIRSMHRNATSTMIKSCARMEEKLIPIFMHGLERVKGDDNKTTDNETHIYSHIFEDHTRDHIC